jgi:hypothetical protein
MRLKGYGGAIGIPRSSYFGHFRIQLQRKKASMTHFGECIRFSLVNRRLKPTEGQREDPVAGIETRLTS